MILSIIIPVYNIESYLCQCINSLLCNNKDYEIILVDDGSTDNSPQICDNYALKYKFIHSFHKPNGGVSSARNLGIEKAKGKYIYFVDGDDYVKGINYLINTLQNEDTEGFVLNCILLDSNDNIICKYEYDHVLQMSIAKDYCGQQKKFHAPWNFVYRRDIMLNNCILFDIQLNYAEDWLFVVQYLTHIKTVQSVKNFFYCYRKERIGSAMNSKYTEENIWRYFDAYDKMCQIKPVNNKHYYNIERRNLLSYIISVAKHHLGELNDIVALQKSIRKRITFDIFKTTNLKFIIKIIVAYLSIRSLYFFKKNE